MDTTQLFPATRTALSAHDAGLATADDVIAAFAAETAAYNRADQAREVATSAAGLAWLRETFGGVS